MSGKLSGTGGGHNRRNFLKTGFVAAGATAVGAVLSEHGTLVAAAQSSGLNAGDVAILQFLAAGELLEVDFWTQYNELGESRTVRFLEGRETPSTPSGSGRSIGISRNTFTTTPTTRSVTRRSSMRISFPGVPSQ
jgi:hypothetical protein